MTEWDAAPDLERALQDERARQLPKKKLPSLVAVERKFSAIGEDRYRLSVPDLGVVIEVDRLRREHGELIGELSVRCDLPGARTFDGSLSIADINLSANRTRQERAKFLAGRAGTGDQLDWTGLLEEFAQRVLNADRIGKPAVDLRQLERPDTAADMIEVEGLTLPRSHPTILFGDGGTGKSYLALYLAGRIAEMGIPVMLADWELCGEDHRDRLERLFGDGMPRILYARCERPLVYEADRLRREARENGILFTVFDSIAFAADGPPESAETAGKYFRGVRQIGGGSIHVAHITKGENGDKKPFGSAFWHNGARSTWFVQAAEGSSESGVLKIALFNRKSNLARLQSPRGFEIEFTDEWTKFRRTDVAGIAASPDLALSLTVPQRMKALLRYGALDPRKIAEEIDAKLDTVNKNVFRHSNLFMVLDGGRIGLRA